MANPRYKVKLIITDPDGVVLETATLIDNDDNPSIEVFGQAVYTVISDHFENEDADSLNDDTPG